MLSFAQSYMHRFILMIGKVDVQSTTGRILETIDTGCVCHGRRPAPPTPHHTTPALALVCLGGGDQRAVSRCTEDAAQERAGKAAFTGSECSLPQPHEFTQRANRAWAKASSVTVQPHGRRCCWASRWAGMGWIPPTHPRCSRTFIPDAVPALVN